MSSRLYALGVILALGALAVSGCVPSLSRADVLEGSGNMVTMEESFSDFDSVKVSHAFRVDITRGERFGVVVRVDDNLVQYLDVARRGQTLVIGLKPDLRSSLRGVAMEAQACMPDLTGLDLSGASKVTIGGFRSDRDLDVELSGDSSLKGDIEAADIRLDISGTDRVTVSGSADDLRVDASGASKVDLSALEVGQADVDASGTSEVTVNAADQLNVRASGGSRLDYLGGPTLETVSTLGGASIEKR